MMEIKTEDGQSYTIPLDSVDLAYLSKYIHTPNAEKRPLWTRKCLDGESEYCHVQIVTRDDNEDCYSEETFDTFICHICNVEVPILCFKVHNESEKHDTLKTIFQKVLERVSKQINICVSDIDKDMDNDVYYCVPCSKIIRNENKLNHESSQYHVKSHKAINTVREFNKIFEENKGHVVVKKVETEEILNEESFDTEVVQNDTENDNVEDVTNDHTVRPTCSVQHSVPNYNQIISEENYIKNMAKKYNLTGNLPIVDGEFILVANPSGVTVKISRDHFHSYVSVAEGTRLFCQMCYTRVERRKERKHKVSKRHASNVFLPVNEQFGRSRNAFNSHCLICNTLVMTMSLTKHLCNDKHVKLLNSAKLPGICQNNEDLANSINTENNMNETHTEHKIENDVPESEEIKMIECIDDKEYICELNSSENDLGDHRNKSGHVTKTEDATSVQKLVVSELWKVSVPQDQMESHNTETSHSSKTLKTKNSTSVADGLQACFSKDILKTDSEAQIQNDTPRNDNVAEQNSTLKTDHVTNQNVTLKNYNNDVLMKCTENDVFENDKCAKQNDILKNDNVAKKNDVSENDNVTNQNQTFKNDNCAKQNDVPKNDNESNQNDTQKNDNVAKQNGVPENNIVTKKKAICKNDNVTNQNDTLENDNNDVSMKYTENGVPKNSSVPEQNDVPKNNVAKQNDSSENDNVSNQNDTQKNHNVAQQNDVSENDNETNQNAVSKNLNVTIQIDTLQNDNVAKQNDVPKNDYDTNQNGKLKDNVAKRNDSSDNDNVAKQNDVSENDKETNQNAVSKNNNVAKQNDTLKNDNVTSQNVTLKNDNVAKQNNVSENDNETNENAVSKNDNVAKQNNVSENDNETNENAVSKNDNVAKQNDVPINDNVAKQNDEPKNDNVTNQNDTKNDNVTNQNDTKK